ncbi:hypothetical protein C5B85_09490 [Pseudoclavibacter sp. AY1F1]|uniref:hypothetical protein n=1 Tax=Pseudoclavibacter sp. AY1F1 TaxID=2080583 RepID=UPI000CE8A2F8|nr:hypothetical protein [Pseudoclavibacter sp. AY1F1]PPF44383.1 hypothetical protein C5B85_09490 [Pseudoclavibacter sp. AY1F1]
MPSPHRSTPARWQPAGLGLVCAVAFVLSGCAAPASDAGSAPNDGSSPPGASAPGTDNTDAGADGAEDADANGSGELVLAATADNRHSWITAEARVVGVTQSGTCEYTASAEGVDTITRTAKALASNYDTICGDISFELGTPGTYTITVSITDVADEPLTASTQVEFLGASAD